MSASNDTPTAETASATDNALWRDYATRWRRAMAAAGIKPGITIVDAVLEDASDFHTVWSGRGTWWKRGSLAKYPVVNWKDGLGAVVMGDPGYATRTSVDFPRQPSGVRQVARLLSRARDNDDVMIAAMLVASDEQHRRGGPAFHALTVAARNVIAQYGFDFTGGANCDRFLPHRNNSQLPPREIDELMDWLVEEHVENLRHWTPVDFRGWLLTAEGYQEITDRDVSSAWSKDRIARMDERAARRDGVAQEPRRPAARAAKNGDEAMLREAIQEYMHANGIKAPTVEFGVHGPTEIFNIACRIEAGKVKIIRSNAPGERNQRGVRWSRIHTVEAVLKGDEAARLRTIRALVHRSLESYAGFVRRVFALRTKREGKDLKEPLWSMDVHPYVRALHPDLTRLIKLDPADVQPANPYQPQFELVGKRTWGHVRPDGTLLEMRDVTLAKGLDMNQDKTGTYLVLDRGFPSHELDTMVGRDAADVIGIKGLPEGVTIRTANGGARWTRLKVDDAIVPAADLPEGIEDWRAGGVPPLAWGASASAKLVKPRRERTPIAHAVGRKWARRRRAAEVARPAWMHDEFSL